MSDHKKETEKFIEELRADPSVGRQRIVCQKFMGANLSRIHPQVICLMLAGERVSFPIYDLLRKHAQKSQSFRTCLFFALKSSLGTADEYSAAYCYFLCCELIDMASSEQKRNRGVLLRNYLMRHPESFTKVVYNNLHLKLRSGQFCGSDRAHTVSQSTKRSSVPLRPLRRTRGLILQRSRIPSFEGLWVFFARAIASLTSPLHFRELDKYMRVFVTRRNIRSLNLVNTQCSVLKQNMFFYSSLVEISSRVKRLPVKFRQRALEVELELLNMKPLNKVLDPFNPKNIIVNILVDECSVLDSADNVPYMVFVETVDHCNTVMKSRNRDCHRAGVLWSHLNSLIDLGDVGDVDAMRENILEALERVIFAREVKNSSRVSLKKADKILGGDKMKSSKQERDSTDKAKVEDDNECSSEEKVVEEAPGDAAEEGAKILSVIDPVPGTSILLEGEPGSAGAAEYVDRREHGFAEKPEDSTERENDADDSASCKAEPETEATGKLDLEGINRILTVSESSSVKEEKDTEKSVGVEGTPTNEPIIYAVEDKATDQSLKSEKGDINEKGSESIYTAKMPSFWKKKRHILLRPELRAWDKLKSRVALSSPLSGMLGWKLNSLIIKSGSALKFEYLSHQIISEMKQIFIEEDIPIFLNDYKIYLVSDSAGFVETVTNTISVHKIKETYKDLLEYYRESFTDVAAARQNFLYSLVGYSLASFVLQLKDRHNGNILIDGYGNILHVDFSFVLGRHPGFYGFENAPFKFSDDYLALIDINEFRKLFCLGFIAVSRHIKRIVPLVEVVETQGLCEQGTAALLKARMDGGSTEEAITNYCKNLVDRSIRNMRTIVYDTFQYLSNGYY